MYLHCFWNACEWFNLTAATTNSPVFVLTAAVVGMEQEMFFAEGVFLQEVMEQANDGVGSLACVSSLVYQVIDLTIDCVIILVVIKLLVVPA